MASFFHTIASFESWSRLLGGALRFLGAIPKSATSGSGSAKTEPAAVAEGWMGFFGLKDEREAVNSINQLSTEVGYPDAIKVNSGFHLWEFRKDGLGLAGQAYVSFQFSRYTTAIAGLGSAKGTEGGEVKTETNWEEIVGLVKKAIKENRTEKLFLHGRNNQIEHLKVLYGIVKSGRTPIEGYRLAHNHLKSNRIPTVDRAFAQKCDEVWDGTKEGLKTALPRLKNYFEGNLIEFEEWAVAMKETRHTALYPTPEPLSLQSLSAPGKLWSRAMRKIF